MELRAQPLENEAGMEILTPLQQKVLTAFFSAAELKKKFYVTGGTALSAFYLEHRLSDDLDFFTHGTKIHTVERIVEDAFREAGLEAAKLASSPSFRRYRIANELQVDVVEDVEFRFGTPQLRGDFMVDNPTNIAVNKVTAIYGRLDPKDYVDLYFLKPYLDFNILELLDWARKKDAGIENFRWAQIIGDVDTFTVLPNMIRSVTLAELKKFFHALREEITDALKP